MPSISQFLLIFSLLLFSTISEKYTTTNSVRTSLNFKVVHKDKIIGSLKATKTIKDSKIHYQSITCINTKVIKDIEVNYQYDVIYENSILKKANVAIDVNDKPYADILTNWENSYYQITKNGKKELVVEDNIDYATILLYFEEPKNVDSCYSEQDGSFNQILALGNHTYKKINSNNNENTYYYQNGILESAEIDGGLIKFKLVAQK
ncbi:DUF6134 family protein [uncultured Maribacter sp.]|uniref:DUF6134 family protein n=1 Tax=uncultured Maribacter sp. TaxID=431308 RepID=UPI0030ED23D5|tara:strand:- start:34047 stop:34664 length:618 start_codon:yes stop_codon:yes gene_type:complete